jgi:uncharacterized damage-inducible protein DinB
MGMSDPLRVLLAHDRWATGEILRACEGVSEEGFHRRFEMGVGSLHDTVTHILGAMQTWEDTLRVPPPLPMRARLEGTRRTIAELWGLHESVTAAFAEAALARPVEEEVRRERGGKVWVFTRGVVVTHVATHGMHHRAQCLNMLKQVGVEKLPLSSVVEWSWMEGGGGER